MDFPELNGFCNTSSNTAELQWKEINNTSPKVLGPSSLTHLALRMNRNTGSGRYCNTLYAHSRQTKRNAFEKATAIRAGTSLRMAF